MANDPFAEIRDHLHAAVNDAIAGLDYSHSQLLGQQVSAQSHEPDSFLPALLCALSAEAFGAEREAAMAAGTAFALAEASAYVIDDLVAAESGADTAPRGLIGAWGVPRTLNAADGFFALAHESLHSLHDLDGFTTETVLGLSSRFQDALRAWSEESEARLNGGGSLMSHPSVTLVVAAVEIGARTGGVAPDAARRLAAAFVSQDTAGIAAVVSPSQAGTLFEAATYLAGVITS